MILELCTDIWTPSFTILKKRPVSFIWVKSKVDGPWEFNWTVQTTESRRSYIKVDGPRWKSWLPKWMKLDEWKLRDESGRSKKPKVSSSTVHFGANPVQLGSRPFSFERTVHFRSTVHFRNCPLSPLWTVHFRPDSKLLVNILVSVEVKGQMLMLINR